MEKSIHKDLFFKAVDLIIMIGQSKSEQNYALRLSKSSKIGYARVHQLLKIFEKENIIIFYKLNNRTNGVKLTEKGQKLLNQIQSIKKYLNI